MTRGEVYMADLHEDYAKINEAIKISLSLEE